MGARGLLSSIEVSWVNAESLGLAGVEIWGGMANNRDLATRLAVPAAVRGTPQAWALQGLRTGDTWYFWIRSVKGDGTASTWTPSNPLAGWSATVLGIDNNSYDVAYGETMSELRWLLEQLLLEVRALREATERQRGIAEELTHAH